MGTYRGSFFPAVWRYKHPLNRRTDQHFVIKVVRACKSTFRVDNRTFGGVRRLLVQRFTRMLSLKLGPETESPLPVNDVVVPLIRPAAELKLQHGSLHGDIEKVAAWVFDPSNSSISQNR